MRAGPKKRPFRKWFIYSVENSSNGGVGRRHPGSIDVHHSSDAEVTELGTFSVERDFALPYIPHLSKLHSLRQGLGRRYSLNGVQPLVTAANQSRTK